MNRFHGSKIYETDKNNSDCFYVDLESEKSDEMLHKCSENITENLNNYLKNSSFNSDNIEGFTSNSNCCPDGTTSVNNTCVEVCKNCKYNDCNYGSSNLGYLYNNDNLNSEKKENKNLKFSEDIFNYIVIEFPDN